MQVVYERCCGIDVHKKMVVVNLRTGRKSETREFGTYTKDLRKMATWLKESGCQMVAMESTGSYWKPLLNIFELEGINAIVVNAQHMKAVPGRKTDVKDAEWISDLLRHGLLRASFIPDKEQRDLRDLLRYRKSKIEDRARELNRLQKFLEGANIKLAGTISDINGVTGKKLLDLIASGDDVNLDSVAACRDPNIKVSAEQLLLSVEGIVSLLQRELIYTVLCNIRELDSQIERLDALVHKHMNDAYTQAAQILDALPGIAIKSAQVIVGEIGIDMSRFPNAHHLSSWAGLSPGNHESAGKSKGGRTNKANKTLKTTLTQCAHIACRDKKSFFYAQYQRLVVRRGKKKAVIAVAHSMLIAIYHVLSGEDFKDLGGDYYTRFNTEKKIHSHLKQLERLGWKPPSSAVAS